MSKSNKELYILKRMITLKCGMKRYPEPVHMRVPKLVIIVSTDNLLLIGAGTPTGNIDKYTFNRFYQAGGITF